MSKGGGGGGGSLISGSLQYFVISDVWDILFSRFHSFGVLVRCLSFKDFANVQYFWGYGTLRVLILLSFDT